MRHALEANKYDSTFRDCLPKSSGKQLHHEKHQGNKSVGSKNGFDLVTKNTKFAQRTQRDFLPRNNAEKLE